MMIVVYDTLQKSTAAFTARYLTQKVWYVTQVAVKFFRFKNTIIKFNFCQNAVLISSGHKII